MNDSIAKRLTNLLFDAVPAAVAADPASHPETLARNLTDSLTDAEAREILNELMRQRVIVAGQAYAHRRHQV